MTTKWAKPLAIRQNEAGQRAKMPNKSYTEYCINKADLCKLAYPDSTEQTIIEKIRSRMDIEADKFCNEMYSLDNFTTELIRYDHILSRSLVLYQNSPNPYQNKRDNPQFDFGFRNDNHSYNRFNTLASLERTNPLASGSTAQTGNRLPVRALDNGRQDPAQRKLSIKDRMNPATGKMTRSFTNCRGETKFIKRPCDKCLARGQSKWHF